MFLLVIFANLLLATTNGEKDNCYCVPKDMCLDSNHTEMNIIDIRFDRGNCKNYLEVCCKNVLPSLSGAVNAVATSSVKESYSNICGYKNDVAYNTRITGETHQANFGEIPWMVAILFSEDRKLVYKCGGSLIHPQVVLTAAHCVENVYAQWMIRAGERDTKNEQEPLPYQDQLVKEIVKHPEFHPGSLKNDLALLVLDYSLQLAPNVGTVCLPAQDHVLEIGNCMASGWGKSAIKVGKHSSVLKVVQLPLVEKDLCQSALRNTRLGSYYQLHKSFICAGGESDRDTCKGDGGSPLTCLSPSGRYFQAGIVSWGIGCGEQGTPGVYTNVALFRHWIDEQMVKFDLDANSYAELPDFTINNSKLF